MRILLITQHYWPETVGTAQRARRLAQYFAAAGHDIHVQTGIPNHPSMDKYFGHRYPRSATEVGVRVHRVPVIRFSRRRVQTTRSAVRATRTSWSPAQTSAPMAARVKILRTLTYASWVAAGMGTSLVEPDSWDVVVAISPLPTALVGVLASLHHRVPLIFDVQDIWPDAAIQAGIISSPLLIRTLESIENWCYARSAALVTLSNAFADQLRSRGVPKQRIHVIPNAVALQEPDPRDVASIRKTWGVAAKDTVVLYAGNLGVVQDLDVLLEAARRLRDAEHIHWVIVGEGVDRDRLEQVARSLPNRRIRFEPYQSPDRLPAYLSAADILFLALKPGRYTPGTVPSKLYEYFGAGKPVVNLVTGAAADVVDDACAGINIAPGDATSLDVALFALHTDPSLRRDLGANAVAYARNRGSWQVEGKQYLTLLEQILAQYREDRPRD